MSNKEAPFEWVGVRPVDNGEMEAFVRADMRACGVNMRKPKRLIFSTVMLSSDIDGPSVTVWGQKGGKSFIAEYRPKTEWVSINEIEGGAA